MKELLKPLLTWFAGLFNLGIYISDDIDSLLIKLQILRQIHLTKEMEQLHETFQFLEVTKCVLMTLSFLSVCLLNHDEIRKGFYDSWSWVKQKYSSFKKFISNLFRKKHKNN